MNRICLITLLAASLALPSLAGVARADEKCEDGECIESRIMIFAGPGNRTLMLGHGRGFLGAELADMTSELRTYFGVPQDAGVLVTKVVPDSPAQTTDLRVGDVITAVDGETVDSPWDLMAAIRPRDAGDRLTLEVWRDGSRLELTPTLDERKHAHHDLGKHLRWMRNLGGDPPSLELEGIDAVEIDVDLGRIAESLRDIDWDDLARRLPHRELDDRMDTLERRLQELAEKLEEAERR